MSDEVDAITEEDIENAQAMERAVHTMVLRKRAEHLERAVGLGIISQEQAGALYVLYERELNEMVERDTKAARVAIEQAKARAE